MTQDEQDTLVQLEQDEARSRRHRQVGVWALLAIVLALAVVTAYGLTMGHQRQQQVEEQQVQIDALVEEASDSDEAAKEVASQRQAQARTVLELCESGAIEQDDAGVAVCDEAERAAEEDPAQTVAQAKAGPQGPPGPPGRPGSDGEDGADSTEPGPPGAPGADSSVPGPEGAPGADGEDSTVPGPQGEKGDPGADGESVKGEKGEPGATGSDGESVKGDTGDTGPQGPAGKDGQDGTPGKDSTVPGPRGEPGPAGEDGQDGRGIDSATCDPDTGRWTITYSDDTSEDAGPCIAATPDEPAPTPTPTAPEEETP